MLPSQVPIYTPESSEACVGNAILAQTSIITVAWLGLEPGTSCMAGQYLHLTKFLIGHFSKFDISKTADTKLLQFSASLFWKML